MLSGVVDGEHFAADASLIQADANKLSFTSKEDWEPDAINPSAASRAVVEYLFALEYLLALDGAVFGPAIDVTPEFTSHSDPSSQWTAAHHGPAEFAFSNNYLIDTDNAIIPSRACLHAREGIRPSEPMGHSPRTSLSMTAKLIPMPERSQGGRPVFRFSQGRETPRVSGNLCLLSKRMYRRITANFRGGRTRCEQSGHLTKLVK